MLIRHIVDQIIGYTLELERQLRPSDGTVGAVRIHIIFGVI